MRALSVKQPWAELIARGDKKIEYRTWKVDFREDLLIVSSASRNDAEVRKAGLVPTDLGYGVAVCVVRLAKVTGSLFAYRWHVEAPRRVEAIAVKGSAAIYRVPDERIRFTTSADQRARAPTAAVAKPKKPKVTASPAPRSARRPIVGKLLVAARSTALTKAWARELGAHGYRVDVVNDGYAAFGRVEGADYDGIVLAFDVAGFSASEVTARTRAIRRHASTPIIVVGGTRGDAPAGALWLSTRAKADGLVRLLAAEDGAAHLASHV